MEGMSASLPQAALPLPRAGARCRRRERGSAEPWLVTRGPTRCESVLFVSRFFPVVGEVFAAWSERDEHWVLIQVTALEATSDTRRSEAAAVLLRWDEVRRPLVEELGTLAVWRPPSGDPLQHWCSGVMPAAFESIGVIEPLVKSERLPVYGGWGSFRLVSEIWRRYAARPANERHAHAQAVASPPVIRMVNADRLESGAHTLTADDAVIERPVPSLTDRLLEHSFLTSATLRDHGLDSVDISRTQLRRLTIDATGLRELRLPPELESLTLEGAIDADLIVDAARNGRWLTVHTVGGVRKLRGLDALRGLVVRGITQLDVASLVDGYPELRSLALAGRPGHVTNLSSLAALNLEYLALEDVFGFGPADIPSPDDLPQLETLRLSSVPADVISAARLAWRRHVELGRVLLDVSRPRKPDWLRANLDNPFRDWDGAASITRAQAKAAAAHYRRLVTELAKPGADTGSAVETYIRGFNRIHARRHVIETVEREQVLDVLAETLRDQPPADKRALLDLANRIRDF